MVSRGHVLYVILLPLLAQVAADEADEQIMAEVISRSHESPDSSLSGSGPSSSSSSSASEHHLIPNPLPPALLLQLLSSGALLQEHAIDNDLNAEKASTNSNSLDNEEEEAAAAAAADAEERMAKRVFCNGFTGCGGRHRDRSRRQDKYGKRLIPILVKRPFCNSFGCYNAKRSLGAFSMSPAGGARVASHRARALAKALGLVHRVPAGVVGDLEGRGKRLFCNGYGGCRGFKRSLFSPWMSKMNSVAEGRR